LVRYRLRLLLQEIDLPYGETVLGRSADANLTIEDPLVSRIHARIVIDDSGGRVEDLESRNGVRVNGVLIKIPTRLNDGDRVRLGTQDLIFCRVEQGSRHNRTTGVLRLCANCRLPYPREMGACPNCESTEQMEEQTLQGDDLRQEKGIWGTQLLVEALERAISHGRMADAERIVRRATAEFDGYVGAGGVMDNKTLALLAIQTAASTVALGDPVWALWAVETYRRMNRVPTAPVVRALGDAANNHGGSLLAPLRRLADQIHLKGEAAGLTTVADQEGLARLDELLRSNVSIVSAAREVGRTPEGSGRNKELGREGEESDPDATLGIEAHFSKRR
jgi:hypothetical protein